MEKQNNIAKIWLGFIFTIFGAFIFIFTFLKVTTEAPASVPVVYYALAILMIVFGISLIKSWREYRAVKKASKDVVDEDKKRQQIFEQEVYESDRMHESALEGFDRELDENESEDENKDDDDLSN